MLDVKTVGSDLTPAQQDEILIDLSYSLGQFGSTRAVRTKLQEQEVVIKRLRRQAQHFVNRRTDKDDEEEHSNNQDNPPHCCEVAMDVVDETMTNLDFFLRTFGSTRAVRAKLASQRQEIADLERTVQERQRRISAKIEDEVAPLTDAKSFVDGDPDTDIKDGNCATLAEKAPDTVTIDTKPYKGDLQSGPSASIVSTKCLSSEAYYAALKTVGAVCGPKTTSSSNFSKENKSQIHLDPSSMSVRQPTSSKPKYCRQLGCERTVQLKGLYYRHGGYHLCKVDGCNRKAIKQRLCRSHGGGTKCKIDDCDNFSRPGLKGYCRCHGLEQGVNIKTKRMF